MMKKLVVYTLSVAICFLLAGCRQEEKKSELVHREFYQTVWERFDFVGENIEVTTPSTFDLMLRLCFTDDYVYDYISMVFTVFDASGTPYRSKAYRFKLKDEEGHWNSQLVDGCYTFELPINKALQITEAGTYLFQIEQTIPTTPLVGVKELSLINNNPN